MTVSTAGKSKIYVGSTSNTAPSLAEYEADSYIEIGQLQDLGEFGGEASAVTYTTIADRYTHKLAGTIDSGTLELICARSPADPGQIILKGAVTEHLKRRFKVVLNDAPDSNGTPSVFYFWAVTRSARSTYGDGNEVITTTFVVDIDGEILEIEAEAGAISLTPSAGALPAGTEGTPYTQTFVAAGGSGSIVYTVSAGALPAGLTLNAASGVLSGTPTADGSYTFTVTATYSGTGTVSAAYTLEIAA